jgi:hypothetical protein
MLFLEKKTACFGGFFVSRLGIEERYIFHIKANLNNEH